MFEDLGGHGTHLLPFSKKPALQLQAIITLAGRAEVGVLSLCLI